jgi:hypothetical protein
LRLLSTAAPLERFLRQCHPGMLVALPDLHRAMQGHHVPEQITAMDDRRQRSAGQDLIGVCIAWGRCMPESRNGAAQNESGDDT